MRRSFVVAAWIAGAIALALETTDAPADADASPAPTPTAAAAAASTNVHPPVVEPPPIDTVERMCALLTSCPRLPLPGFAAGASSGDLGACVEQMDNALSRADALSFSLTLRECALTATSCDALRTCALRGVKPDACAGRGKSGAVGFCDEAGRAVTCVHGDVAGVRDCPRGSEECSASGGSATCTLGACTFDGGVDVASGSSAPYCSASGTHLLACTGGKLASVDCAAFGLACVSADAINGGVGCAPPKAGSVACSGNASADAPQRCEGNVAIGCLRGREVRVDCAAAGAGMVCNSGSAFDREVIGFCRAAGAGDAGSASDGCAKGPSRCDGSTVVSCDFGKTRRFPCDSIGLTRCVQDGQGARCK